MLLGGREQGPVRRADGLIDFQAARMHGGIGLDLSLCFKRHRRGGRWHVPAHKGVSRALEDFLTIPMSESASSIEWAKYQRVSPVRRSAAHEGM